MTFFRTLVFCLAAVTVSLAQTNTGTLRGQIKDPSGAVIPGAVITARGPQSRSTTTDQQGAFVLNLAPGIYSIRVAAKGFSTANRPGVAIAAGQTLALDASLLITQEKQEVTVTDQVKVELDPSANVGAIVLRGEQLDILSDNPDDLASDLQALAGPSAGPNGGQIYIDGFTGGRLPPKESIREVRINSNPFSSEYDRLGFGRIEIFTKPGTDKYRGQAFFNFGDNVWNSRNPYAPTKAPYQSRMFGGNVSGPISKRSSFFIDAEKRDIDENAVVNAFIVDPTLNIVPFSQAIVTPVRQTTISPRIDYALNQKNTLVGRYTYSTSKAEKEGIGDFSLPSRAYDVDNHEHTVQVTETAILSAHAINETRFQFISRRNNQVGNNSTPGIVLPEAFTGGGSSIGLSFTNEDRYEIANSTSIALKAHTLKAGARIRGVKQDDSSTSNYNGTFTFNSLSLYQRTLQLLAQGVTGAQIRAQGGGASQFTITGGTSLAGVRQFDVGAFVQDDWRVRSNFTLSLGLRYEAQNNIGDHADFAPRIGIAWGIGSKQRQPKTVIRGGFGMFYDRFSEDLTLQAIRLNGVTQDTQQQFIVNGPDFFPNVPTISTLTANRQPQAIRRIDSSLEAPYVLQTAIGVDQQLPHNLTVSVNYTNTRGLHQLRSRNINAPLPGTFNPLIPNSGVRPFGDIGNINLFESSGLFKQQQLITNVQARLNSKFTMFGFVVVGSARSNADGAASFPANQYDLSNEWSRSVFDVRARMFLGGSLTGPLGLRFAPIIIASSGRPYNITLGRDANGDTVFNDRPAFASSTSRTVVHTPYGDLDPNPTFGSLLIPRNYAEAPGQFNMSLR
ncbi:MAG: carboxypeptidase regulatory-like domain-containing protein, partial [Bryobacteraceae bacterium]